MTARRYQQGGLAVPFITPWTHERQDDSRLVRRVGRQGPFLAYEDEIPADRDGFGGLWIRRKYDPGKGRADFYGVHPHRQRLATFRSLCQVGGGSTLEINNGRQLYLMKDVGPVIEGEKTWVPPICVPCALTSVRLCPHLREYVAVWAEYAPSWGVMGILYDPGTVQPVPGIDLVKVPYDDPRMKWVLAARLLVELNGISVADLNELSPGESLCPPLPGLVGSAVVAS